MEKYYYALGRRKTAVVTVRLFEGKGNSEINGKPVEELFPSQLLKQRIFAPLALVNGIDKFYFTAKTASGGRSSQIGALAHGLARSLVKADIAFKPALKKAGMLTRDDRKVERKKTGLRKARKAPQFSKR